jgi:hypothetical protein
VVKTGEEMKKDHFLDLRYITVAFESGLNKLKNLFWPRLFR